jgi:hypothetical protein
MASIPNALQTQSARGQYNRPLETVPLLGVEESADLFDGSVPASNFKKNACHPSHHSAKKGGSHHVHPHLVSRRANLESVENPPCVLHMAVQLLRERTEIVISNQELGALPHPIHV